MSQVPVPIGCRQRKGGVVQDGGRRRAEEVQLKGSHARRHGRRIDDAGRTKQLIQPPSPANASKLMDCAGGAADHVSSGVTGRINGPGESHRHAASPAQDGGRYRKLVKGGRSHGESGKRFSAVLYESATVPLPRPASQGHVVRVSLAGAALAHHPRRRPPGAQSFSADRTDHDERGRRRRRIP